MPAGPAGTFKGRRPYFRYGTIKLIDKYKTRKQDICHKLIVLALQWSLSNLAFRRMASQSLVSPAHSLVFGTSAHEHWCKKKLKQYAELKDSYVLGRIWSSSFTCHTARCTPTPVAVSKTFSLVNSMHRALARDSNTQRKEHQHCILLEKRNRSVSCCQVSYRNWSSECLHPSRPFSLLQYVNPQECYC